MEPRIDYAKASPEALRAMYGLEGFVRRSGIDDALLHLVKMRSSQINGCAYCIDMHSKDAPPRATEQRLYGLDAWRETPFYTPR
jgi:AhpD family alkylhydroperoxidase